MQAPNSSIARLVDQPMVTTIPNPQPC